jgi:hypothetical protein
MKKVEIMLKGWADSLSGSRKVEFVLQLAMYKFTGDCDWQLNIKQDGTKDVRLHCYFKVKATRARARGYDAKLPNTYIDTVEVIELEFITKSYCLEDIYDGAVEAIKSSEYFKKMGGDMSEAGNTRHTGREIEWPEKKKTYQHISIAASIIVDARYNAGYNNAIDACKQAYEENHDPL